MLESLRVELGALDFAVLSLSHCSARCVLDISNVQHVSQVRLKLVRIMLCGHVVMFVLAEKMIQRIVQVKRRKR